MPEGHTLHRLARQITAAFSGETTRSSSPQGRFADGAARIDGCRLEHAEAYGKHLFVEFADRTDREDGRRGDPQSVVHVHLGLYGSWTLTVGAEHPPVGAVRWRLGGHDVRADLRGPNTCELLAPDEVDGVVARLGPDPLRADADPEAAWARIRTSRAPIATLLMDQGVLAGVGNVYRAEVLFRHRLDPLMEGRFLRPAEWGRIWTDLVALMAYGVEHGRIDTVRAAHEPEAMSRPPREDDHGGEVYVYRRAGMPCHVCGTAIRTRDIGARNLFWCSRCQPRSRRRAARRAARV